MVWQMSTKYWKSCLISCVYLSPVIQHKPLGCRIKQIGRSRVATIFLHGCHPSWLPSFALAIFHGGHPSWLPSFMVSILHGGHPSWLPSFIVAILHDFNPSWLPSFMVAIMIANLHLCHPSYLTSFMVSIHPSKQAKSGTTSIFRRYMFFFFSFIVNCHLCTVFSHK